VRRFGVVALCALCGLLVLGLSSAGAKTTARLPADAAVAESSNTVSFTFDRWPPERTVVTSSAVYVRNAGRLLLTITAQPAGKTVALTATVKNVSTGRVRFPASGLQVDDAVVRNGAAIPGWIVRSAKVTSLRPGASVTIRATAPLPRPGDYDVVGSVLYLR